jgi:hypothetical protein
MSRAPSAKGRHEILPGHVLVPGKESRPSCPPPKAERGWSLRPVRRQTEGAALGQWSLCAEIATNPRREPTEGGRKPRGGLNGRP